MISKRNFISMSLTMFVILFMFMAVSIIKEKANRFGENSYAIQVNKGLNADNSWCLEAEKTESEYRYGQYVIYVGEQGDSGIFDAVRQWCTYTKKNLVIHDIFSEVSFYRTNQPAAIVVQGDLITKQDAERIEKYAKMQVPVFFCGTPNISELKSSEELRSLLGIRKIQEESKEVEGIKLFSGFLLGGETEYIVSEDDDDIGKVRQNLELNIPWYILGTGTKTYMVGMLDEKELKKEHFSDNQNDGAQNNNENLPAIIWRMSKDGTKIFVVNGDYINGDMGVGFLDAMMYECVDYQLYPVVNAQNYTVVNMPVLANENEQEIEKIYSRDSQALFRDILWPAMIALTDKTDKKLTCMIATELDSKDDNEPVKSELIRYLKFFKEQNAEAGISLERITNDTMKNVLESDDEWMKKNENVYEYTSVFVDTKNISDNKLNTVMQNISSSDYLANVRTLVSQYSDEFDIVSYAGNGITLQKSTMNGFEHTFSDNIRLKSVQTALAYSNVLIDLKNILWPQDDDDKWEIQGKELARFTETYWKPFLKFENTTLTESDKKVRNMLCLNYKQNRKDNTITLNLDTVPEEGADFVFRTHGEKISEISGGEYVEMENDFYLITATESTVKIQVKLRDAN